MVVEYKHWLSKGDDVANHNIFYFANLRSKSCIEWLVSTILTMSKNELETQQSLLWKSYLFKPTLKFKVTNLKYGVSLS